MCVLDLRSCLHLGKVLELRTYRRGSGLFSTLSYFALHWGTFKDLIMSLYYCTRPDNVSEPDPTFTRYGRLSRNLETACKAARRSSGKVYATDGGHTRLVANYYEEPTPAPRLAGKAYRQARAETVLFGAILG